MLLAGEASVVGVVVVVVVVVDLVTEVDERPFGRSKSNKMAPE